MRAIHAGASKVSEPVLPSRASPKWPRYSALRLVGQPAPSPRRPFGVLLVDENPHHRIPLLRALRDQGHRVLHAADVASGETLCRASQLEIDALVACADMKRMCGCELARRVVRMRPEVRVLLMWRHFAEPEAACRAYDRGYAVIEEPFTPEELCRRLMGLLGSSREDEVLAIGSKREGQIAQGELTCGSICEGAPTTPPLALTFARVRPAVRSSRDPAS